MKNSRLLYGILSLILAVIVAFIAIPAVTKQANTKVEIVRVTKYLKRGTQISSDDVSLVEVGGYNLPSGIASRLSDVIGTYTAAELYPGDYILPDKVSASPISSDPILNQIPDGMLAISVTTQTLATSLSDKLQSGDIIRLYHYNDDPQALIKVEDVAELRFIQVLSVTDPEGLPVDYTKEPDADKERQNTATLTVLATPEQAVLLTQYENEGVLHAALISRGNPDLAKELLDRQMQILEQLYAADDIFTPSVEEEISPEGLINHEFPADEKSTEKTSDNPDETPLNESENTSDPDTEEEE